MLSPIIILIISLSGNNLCAGGDVSQNYFTSIFTEIFWQSECFELNSSRHFTNITRIDDKMEQQIWTPSIQAETIIESRSINNNGYFIVREKGTYYNTN